MSIEAGMWWVGAIIVSAWLFWHIGTFVTRRDLSGKKLNDGR